jgi:hypothetical protein
MRVVGKTWWDVHVVMRLKASFDTVMDEKRTSQMLCNVQDTFDTVINEQWALYKILYIHVRIPLFWEELQRTKGILDHSSSSPKPKGSYCTKLCMDSPERTSRCPHARVPPSIVIHGARSRRRNAWGIHGVRIPVKCAESFKRALVGFEGPLGIPVDLWTMPVLARAAHECWGVRGLNGSSPDNTVMHGNWASYTLCMMQEFIYTALNEKWAF